MLYKIEFREKFQLSTEEKTILYKLITDRGYTLISNVPIEFHTMEMYVKIIDENKYGLYYVPEKQTKKLILKAVKKWGKSELKYANQRIVLGSQEIELANKYD